MKSKNKLLEQKGSNPKGGVPKLRFQEFRNAPEWAEKKLGELALFYKGKGISKADVDQQGKIQCIRYGELYTRYQEVIDTIFSKTNLPISELFFSCKNDVIIPASGETKLDIATASCVPFDGVALGGDINIIRCNQNGIFISYYLNSAKKTEIAKIAQGDSVVHLYSSQLKELDVMLPNLYEQQKIADCLSTLDELIAANTQNLDILKMHKKGLMQQLFPAEGETVPKLRFPEFCYTGEWLQRELSEFITERNNHAKEEHLLFSLTIENGVTPKTERYERSFLVDDEENAYKIILHNDFAYNPMNLRFGAIARYAGEDQVALSKYYNIFCCDKTVDSKFCEAYFKCDNMIMFYNNMAAGTLIEKKRVHFSDFIKFKIPFPSLAEQQKIATFISSLDEVIAGQTKKVDALKAHKKGLMQQLFPSIDEVNG